MVLHTLLSATRGIFYGFSFIVFEERLFFNFFRKCFKNDNIKMMEEEKEINRNTGYSNFSRNSDVSENEKKNEEEKSDTNEMNNSDYQYNEND